METTGGWGHWTLKPPPRPQALLCNLIVGAEFQPQLLALFPSEPTTGKADGVLSFLDCQKQHLKGATSQDEVRSPLAAPGRGWDGRRCWAGLLSLFSSPLRLKPYEHDFSHGTALKKFNQIGLKSVNLSSVTHTELLGYSLFSRDSYTALFFKNLIS